MVYAIFLFISSFLSHICPLWGADAAPTYATVRTYPTNVRVGPGYHYPIAWVFTRSGFPVKVLSQFEHWRKIQDWQGTEGWIHFKMLSSKKSIITRKQGFLYKKPDAKTKKIAKIGPDVIGNLKECSGNFCYISMGKTTGWVEKSIFWGPN